MTEPHAAPAADKGTETPYTVLESSAVNGVTVWKVVNARVFARSAEAAIRAALKANDNAPGEYVAVPGRSWKPVKVTVSQETVVKLGGA